MYRTISPLIVALSFLFSLHHAETQEPVRVIEVHARRFAFEPSSVTLHRGETVRLRLVSEDVPHSLLIKALGINEAASKSHPDRILQPAKSAISKAVAVGSAAVGTVRCTLPCT